MCVLIQTDLRFITMEPGELFVMMALTTKRPLLLVGNLDTSRSMFVFIFEILVKHTELMNHSLLTVYTIYLFIFFFVLKIFVWHNGLFYNRWNGIPISLIKNFNYQFKKGKQREPQARQYSFYEVHRSKWSKLNQDNLKKNIKIDSAKDKISECLGLIRDRQKLIN